MFNLRTIRKLLAIGSLTLFVVACDQSQEVVSEEQIETSKATEAKEPSAVNDTNAINTALKQIDEAELMQHVNILASDEFEGRAPSTPGGAKTVEYLESQFSQLGLEPAFGDSYRQAVSLIEQAVTNKPSLTITNSDGSSDTLVYKENSMLWSTRVGEAASIENSELVFVGYGVVAPEFGWNDYAGVDMSGKTAVILVNDPGFRNPEGDLFKGNTMTYYGRWTYKFEEAAKQGAAGAIIVHETKAAGYPWEVVSGSWSGPQYMLFTDDGNKDRVAVEGWMTQAAAEALFAKNELSYQDMVTAAGNVGFKPVPLSANATASLVNSSRRSTSYNVGAVVKGDVRPDELFIYTGHWDHLGIKPDEGATDVIFNGALDNATGIAVLLEMAQAYTHLPKAPDRSVMFLAVTAEESGLLGSAHYAANPPFPMSKTVAGINMDGLPTAGATDDVVVVGFGNSEMDLYLKEVASTQGRVLVQEPTPEKGFFYRSDHFNLAKKGVPMLYAKAGQAVRNKPEGYGKAAADRYTAERYHKAGDEVHPEWDNGSILQDAEAYFKIGVAISNSNDWPKWAEGNEFQAIRAASQ